MIWQILSIAVIYKIGANLKIREGSFFFFDDDLVEDAFEDDEKTDGENSYYLK